MSFSFHFLLLLCLQVFFFLKVFDRITDYAAKQQQQEEVKSLKDFYQPGSTCFLLSQQYYGEQCEVITIIMYTY